MQVLSLRQTGVSRGRLEPNTRDQTSDTVKRGLRRIPTIYLCGPITGVPNEVSAAWRRKVRTALEGEVEIVDPTRDSPQPVRHSEKATSRALTAERLLHGKRTVARDRFDVGRSDLVLACLMGAKSVSIGAVGEIFWADALGKPVIIVREEDNVHNHDMLNEIAGWIFHDLDSAIEHVRKLIRLDIPASTNGVSD